ncbi:MAG: hypothetical protein ACREMH_02640 [Gemmatimonadales bacterium]
MGSYLGSSRDTLWLEQEESVLAVPAPALIRAWVSEQKRGHATTGAVIGLLVGAAIGTAAGAAAGRSDPGYEGLHAMVGAGMGALGGLFLGAVIGLAVRTDRWVPAAIPLPDP